MAKLYSNENFPLPVVFALRKLGHDVLTIQETGNANKEYADDAVVEAASRASRTVLTINRKDFIRLHRQISHHSGIIVCTSDRDFESFAKRIHEAIEANSPLSGKLIRVHRPSL